MIKEDLSNLIETVTWCINNDYKCNVFRAANWSMYPTKNIVRALLNNNIEIDNYNNIS